MLLLWHLLWENFLFLSILIYNQFVLLLKLLVSLLKFEDLTSFAFILFQDSISFHLYLLNQILIVTVGSYLSSSFTGIGHLHDTYFFLKQFALHLHLLVFLYQVFDLVIFALLGLAVVQLQLLHFGLEFVVLDYLLLGFWL
mgnify:FL=1